MRLVRFLLAVVLADGGKVLRAWDQTKVEKW